MARLKGLGGRLDTMATDENETNEYLNFLYWICGIKK